MQKQLTDNAPMILDATCSFRRRWPRHATIRIDIRPECHPDFVMDACHMTFDDASFDEVYCDPPHLFNPGKQTLALAHRRLTGRTSPNMFQRYGFWTSRKDWLQFIRDTNAEFYRVLKPEGTLYYKLLDGKGNGTTHLSELLEGMTNFVIIKDRVDESKTNFGSKSAVHFLTMKPKEVSS